MPLMFGGIMYKLNNNPILYPHQIILLSLFFASPFAKTFSLTGGTALSAFYLAHRESQDLDLFSLEPFDTLALQTIMQEIANKTESAMISHIRSQTFNEILSRPFPQVIIKNKASRIILIVIKSSTKVKPFLGINYILAF